LAEEFLALATYGWPAPWVIAMTEPGVIMVLGAPLGLRGGGKMKTLRLAAVTALVAPLGALVQMKRFSLAALAGAVALLAPLGVATSAQAAAPVPFTITEQINFATGDATFTATGPLCSKGIFADDVKVFAPRPGSPALDASGGGNLQIRTVYTCEDGSGTFNAIKHVFITFTDDGFTNTGPIQLLGGTGAFTNLAGHGVNNGSTNGDTGGGLISGAVVRGQGA